MKAERVVLDTNVLISAALRPQGLPRAVLDAVRAVNGVLLFSSETFDELRSRLHRPKFDRYVSLEKSIRDLHNNIDDLKKGSELVTWHSFFHDGENLISPASGWFRKGNAEVSS